MNIESFFPGRIRVSSPLFTRRENVDKVRETVGAIEGIRDFSANPRTGSLTILYDPLAITMEMLMNAKGEIEKMEREFSARKGES